MTNEDVNGAGPPNKRLQLQLPLSCDPPGASGPAKQKSWIVFGGTGHMGRSVVKTALAKGDIVTMVGRSQTDDIQLMRRAFSVKPPGSSVNDPKPSTKAKPSSIRPITSSPPAVDRGLHPQLLCLLCDVRVRLSVEAALLAHLRHWGDDNLDVVANCSGYGVFGSCEDQDDAELRNQFETNFWGTLHIVQLALPHLRRRGGGRYLIFSSTSGALGVPGLGPYCATKYAVEGLVESMLYEIESFEIRATLVSPGHVRRDEPEDSKTDAGKTSSPGSQQGETGAKINGNTTPHLNNLPVYSSFIIKQPSAAYSNPTSPAFHAKRVVQWMADSQPTSVVKAAELVWQLAHCSYPPLRLLLGNFAVDSVRDRLKTITEEIEDWKFLSFGEEIDIEKAKERVSGKEPSRENSDDDDEIPQLHTSVHEQQDRPSPLAEHEALEDEDMSEDEDPDDDENLIYE